jgi:hypothetical protein
LIAAFSELIILANVARTLVETTIIEAREHPAPSEFDYTQIANSIIAAADQANRQSITPC